MEKRTRARDVGDVDRGEHVGERGAHVHDVADALGGQEGYNEVDDDAYELFHGPEALEGGKGGHGGQKERNRARADACNIKRALFALPVHHTWLERATYGASNRPGEDFAQETNLLGNTMLGGAIL